MTGRESSRTGRRGQNHFLDYLDSLDWAVQETTHDDRGTDVTAWLDPSGRGQFAALCFQVKTSLKVELSTTREGQYGYTYRETGVEAKQHLKYWTGHSIPHIMVVQSLDDSVRLWQRLDRQHVVETPKGLKICLPANNVVGPAAPPEWLAIASRSASQRYESASRWEIGTGPEVAAVDELRFALLTPRLVAAHPNQSSSAFGSAQALADCALGGREWDRRAGPSNSVPTPQEASVHHEERWRLAGCVYAAMSLGDVSALRALAESASDATVRAAARAVLVSRLLEDARPSEVLVTAQDDSDFSPEDKHWLGTLRVAAHIALGDRGAARAAAAEALSRVPRLKADPTVRQLNASLLWAEFASAPDEMRSIAKVMTAADHSARWWRDEHRGAALEASTRQLFDAWSDTPTVRFGGEYHTHNELFAVSFQARLGGSIQEARTAQSVLARIDIMTFDRRAERVHDALDSLILSGDADSTRDALRRSLRTAPPRAFDGLLSTAVRACGDVDLVRAGVVAMKMLAPYLSSADQVQARIALVDLVVRADAFVGRRTLRSDTAATALSALSAVGLALDESEAEALFEWLLGRTPGDTWDEQAAAEAIGVFDTLALPRVGRQRERALRRLRVVSQDSSQYWAIVAALGKDTRAGRDRLQVGIDSANDKASSLAKYVNAYTADQQAERVAASLAALERERAANVPRGIVIGTKDDARNAMIFALALGDVDAITSVIAYLADSKIQPHKKRGATIVLANGLRSQSSLDVTTIEQAARTMCQQRDAAPRLSLDALGTDLGGAPERLMLEIDALDSDKANVCVARLLRGNTMEREDLCDALATRAGYDLTLAALASDPSFSVRARSASSMAYALCARGSDSDTLLGALAAAVSAGGPQVHRLIRAAVESIDSVHPDRLALKDDVLELLGP
jgi:hypothetical protein